VERDRIPAIHSLEQHLPSGPRRTNSAALLSVFSGALSFVCLWGVGGLLAIALGILARGEIERASGREEGGVLATTGIVLGALNVVVIVIGFAVMITFAARPPAPTRASAPTPTIVHTPLAPRPAKAAGAPVVGGASYETGVRVTRIGAITLTDIGSDVRPISPALDSERKAAEAEQQKLLVWLVVPDCKPCNGVAAALPDPKMQSALSGVRIVRIDVSEFQIELQRMGIPTQKIPGFVLIGSTNRPLDFIHGGEWDADIPANIAPVLGRFVKGKYPTRRDTWRGLARDDETPT
jgi:hypothetical protein